MLFSLCSTKKNVITKPSVLRQIVQQQYQQGEQNVDKKKQWPIELVVRRRDCRVTSPLIIINLLGEHCSGELCDVRCHCATLAEARHNRQTLSLFSFIVAHTLLSMFALYVA